MSSADRRVLKVLQLLVLGLPLFLGGRHPLGVALGLAIVLGLLAWTLHVRARRLLAPEPVGVRALAAFVALALLTTLPLPPAVLAVLSPDAAALYRDVLPGWPGGGGWSSWRPIAFDAHGVWYELVKLGIGFATFVVLVSYPWEGEEEDPRLYVMGTLLLTLVAGGAAFSVLALVHDMGDGERVLWLLEPVATPGRAMGPFVNPNHFAAWLEMVIPIGVAYLGAVAVRLGRHIARLAASSRSMGVQSRRAWAGALASQQGRLWLPLVLSGALLLMLVAHASTHSRGGTMSLLVGLAVVVLGFARPTRREARPRAARLVAAGVVTGLVVLSLVTVLGWSRLEDEVAGMGVEGGDVSLATRIAVSAKGRGIVEDFPAFGTGLGSWLHAFHLYQAPPVEGGIWRHAHNDYLELAAETGLAGLAVAAWFALVVAGAARRDPTPAPRSEDGGGELRPRPAGFETADWRAALEKRSWLRFGLCGSLAAILVHSLVDFGLRLPANLLLLFVISALLVLARPARTQEPSRAIAVFVALLCLAVLPVVSGLARAAAGGEPLSASSLIALSDRALAEQGDRERALALARRAVDRSPADRAAHEAMAVATEGSEAHAALRRAIRLDPWAVELRDWLADALWRDGESRLAAAELEESIARYPYLVSHAFPASSAEVGAASADAWLRELAGDDDLRGHLERLDAPLADAVERGLRRALDERPGGRTRQRVAEDLVLLLEARGRWADAGNELRGAAGITADDAPRLARAASDFLRAGDAASAEEALVAALRLTPEQGDLYRRLAVEVFAVRGDFSSAEDVLRVAQQNSQDMIPVYRGLTKVLTLREAARSSGARYAPVAGPTPGTAARERAAEASTP